MSHHCNDPLTLALFWFRREAISAQCEWALNTAVQPTYTSVVEYLKAFAITNLLEAPFYFWLLRRLPFPRQFFYLICSNLITHPAVYFLFPYIFYKGGQSYALFLTIAEGFAFAAEALFIYLKAGTAFCSTALFVTIANLFSWWVGVLID